MDIDEAKRAFLFSSRSIIENALVESSSAMNLHGSQAWVCLLVQKGGGQVTRSYLDLNNSRML